MSKCMIWTVPRTKGTILAKSLTLNEDVKCFYEPFAFTYFKQLESNFSGLKTILTTNFFGSKASSILKDLPVYIPDR